MAASNSTKVLVTGANQGIGFEIAKKLGTEHSDYHIIMTGRRQEPLDKAVSEVRQLGASAEGLLLDVTSDESITKAVKVVTEKHGHLDVLINNAGISYDTAAKTPREQWHSLFSTNVFSVHSVTEAFLPLLERAKGTKRIVVVSSSMGSVGLKMDPSFPGRNQDYLIYSTSKTALNMLTAHYVVKYEKDPSWKINITCPGHCATNLNNFAGSLPVATGAINACRLATLGPDGETGTFTNKEGKVPW